MEMEKIIEAKTKDDALIQAAKEFGVDPENIEMTVIEHRKGGFLNLSSKKIKVKARCIGMPKDHLELEDAEESDYTTGDEEEDFRSTRGNAKSSVRSNAKPAATISITKDEEKKIIEITSKMIHYMGFEATVQVNVQSEIVVEVSVNSEEDQNLLIGKHGRNVEALQIVVNACLARDMRHISVALDIEGYRERRYTWLQQQVKHRVSQARRSQRAVWFEEMSPLDRKTIHTIVQEIGGFSTESYGDGYYKKIKLFWGTSRKRREKSPPRYLYQKTHEWVVKRAEGVWRIGISEYAQKELGQVMFVDLPKVGVDLEKGETLASIESTKTTSDILVPVSGKVVSVNESLSDSPSIVNTSPLQDGWMVEIEPADRNFFDKELLREREYADFIENA